MTSARRVADLSAAFGGGLWVALVVAGLLGPIERLLALAPLVVVPLCLRMVGTPDRDGAYSRAYGAAVYAGAIAGPLAATSLASNPGPMAGALALPWLVTTVLVALFGLARLLPRGPRPIEELAIDAGLLYVVVGGVGLFANRADLTPLLGFGPTLVLLAGVHFHFAGLVVPVLTGLAGRATQRARRVYRPIAAVVIAGPAFIGLGITLSPALEVVAVGCFTVAVAALAGFVVLRVVPGRERRLQQVALVVSSLVLPVSMLLALAFGVSEFVGRPIGGLAISEMVALHGTLNALGFALVGVLGWRLDVPGSRVPDPGVPLSRITGGRYVGAQFVDRAAIRGSDAPPGQMDDLTEYARDGFDPAAVDPAVRRFYERTAEYRLRFDVAWQPGFRRGAALAARLTHRMEQLALPAPGSGPGESDSRIVDVDDARDGREGVRAWIRTDEETGRALFVALYATHAFEGETYMNIALPLPASNLSAVLRMEADDEGGLRLTSKPRRAGGDEGLYLVTPVGPVRLPMQESFHVQPVGSGMDESGEAEAFDADRASLVATHEMFVFGRRFLAIDYAIERIAPPSRRVPEASGG